MSSDYFKSLDGDAKKRYVEKLRWKDQELPDPYEEHLRENLFKKNDLKKWPQVTFGNVYMYLVIKECHYTQEAFENYKGLECYNFILSGKVQDIRVYRDNALQICVMTCHVQASQTLKKFHCPWAVIECSGKIQNAHCTCMAGLGEACSHISALLLSVEIGVREQKLQPSCTSIACEWKKSVKKVPLVPSSSLSFSHKKRKVCNNISAGRTFSLSSEESFKRLLGVVRTHQPDAAYFTTISDTEETDSASEEETENLHIPSDMDTVKPEGKHLCLNILIHDFKNTGCKTIEEFINFCKQKMDVKSCTTAEFQTKEQSNSPLWHELRYGRITASKAHEASRCKTLDGSLVKEILGARKIKETLAMKRGKTLEKKVLEVVNKLTQLNFKSCGIMLSGKTPLLGASADGISLDCVLEIKCPSLAKSMGTYITPNGKLTLKCYSQIQLQMFFYEKRKGIFCIASPDFETSSQVTLVNVERNDDFIKDLIIKCYEFWRAAIFPFLMR